MSYVEEHDDGEAIEGLDGEQAVTNAPVEPIAVREASGDDFDSIYRSMTTKGPGAIGGAPLLKRREVSFVVDGGVCMLRPDGAPVFSDEEGNVLDLRIGMRSLTSAEELEAFKLAKAGEPEKIPMLLAQRAIFSVGGRKLSAAQKEWLWEALGSGGRQICLVAFSLVGSASAGVLGKYQASITYE